MMERAKKLLQLAFLLLTDLKSFQLGVWEFVWLKRLGGFKEYRIHSSIKLLTARWYLKMMLRKLGSGEQKHIQFGIQMSQEKPLKSENAANAWHSSDTSSKQSSNDLSRSGRCFSRKVSGTCAFNAATAAR